MPADDEPGFFSVRPKVLILIGAVTSMTLMIACVTLWFGLPRWFPDIVMEESPWVGPALDAAIASKHRSYVFVHRAREWSDGQVLALCAELHSRNPERRRLAAESLCERADDRSVPDLIGALDDVDYQVKNSALRALLQIPDVRVTECLITRLVKSGPTSTSDGLAIAIARLRPPGIHDHVSALLLAPTASPELRLLGLIMLGGSDDPRSLAVLDAHLGVSCPPGWGQDFAAMGLGMSPLPGAEEIIRRALADQNPKRRWAGCQAAAEHHLPSLLDPLLSLAADPSAEVREVMVGVLGNYQQPAAVEFLTQALTGDDQPVMAAHALGANRSPAAKTVMIAHLDHPRAEVRVALARHLPFRSDLTPADIEAVMRLLTDPDPTVVQELKTQAHRLMLTKKQRELLKKSGQ